MVSESVQTNGLVSPPNHSINLPPNWYGGAGQGHGPGPGRPYGVQTLPHRAPQQQYRIQVGKICLENMYFLCNSVFLGVQP